ncbi:nuclease-related domain-containing DEAD/DEAH box helicase [Phaeocystidibacter luteus]|uniref:AAA family ATPase n=1 Tax=Phaeocystidibacter luteus TaxID=911197 RepID=A0A6N6RI22_9FLAO|nr:NERD domain-containing protein [Phaeocystidibacter luteus]KAB2810004.1 AAA family ATPase [Phaeocystidibacter luteus]
MATLYPALDLIRAHKVQPELGELHLLEFLDRELDDSFEVFFNPFMNGDRPDIVIMKKGQGILIIEVKDYNLDLYELDKRKNFVVKSSDTKTFKSPISQVLKYKENLFELHVDKLLEHKIKDYRFFNVVSCAVYFHNANSSKINSLLVDPFEQDKGYQKFLNKNIDLIGRDNLNTNDFTDLLKRRYLISNKPSFLFTDDLYISVKRFLKPPLHTREQGENIRYSRKQLDIIYDATRKEQRIKGVVGSGKTTVLAGRAVQAHKRTGGRVLILTFNITLKNFIHDKISKVREDFAWENFVITNYHHFINSELNNLGIPIEVPDDFDNLDSQAKDRFFESNYYSNKKLFEANKDDIRPYDVILVDEIQDYKRPWMEILKEYFLQPGGEYVLFGDVKQNIYHNQTEGKDVATNVRGVTELKNCFRSDFKIKDLAIEFQKQVFQDKYEIDDFNKSTTLEIDFKTTKEGSINYIHLPNANAVSSLYTIIHQNAINKDIPPNDITILGNSIELLKDFDAYYRYASGERTNTMFESHEMTFRIGLSKYGKSRPMWVKSGLRLIERDMDYNESRGYNQLCKLLVAHDLYIMNQEQFVKGLTYLCEKFKTSFDAFIKFSDDYGSEIKAFKTDFSTERLGRELKSIRNNKKIHFYLNSGTIKISTIHSFKGWECDTVFLIIEDLNFNEAFDEILYTGITRSKSNLVIINYGNVEQHEKLKEMVATVNH